MAQDELATLEPRPEAIEDELKVMLLPKDPNDDKNIILEIRAGTGGDEASLFAPKSSDVSALRRAAPLEGGDPLRVSVRRRRTEGSHRAWSKAASVYSQMKYESGVHRVQRVPATETQGRVHTSAITVAVLPEAEEVDVKVEAEGSFASIHSASRAREGRASTRPTPPCASRICRRTPS